MLGHRLFPQARYSIWVDSKSQFRRDPLGVLEALLWRTNSTLAISEHGARSSFYDEVRDVVKKHKTTPEEVEVQLSKYRHDGFPDDKRYNGKKGINAGIPAAVWQSLDPLIYPINNFRYYNNAYYAKVGGISTAEMNFLEVDFLIGLRFHLNVTPSTFQTYYSHLQREMIILEAPLNLGRSLKLHCRFTEDESTHQTQQQLAV